MFPINAAGLAMDLLSLLVVRNSLRLRRLRRVALNGRAEQRPRVMPRGARSRGLTKRRAPAPTDRIPIVDPSNRSIDMEIRAQLAGMG